MRMKVMSSSLSFLFFFDIPACRLLHVSIKALWRCWNLRAALATGTWESQGAATGIL
ncbi:hypothetical protein RchiOBHm_Chr4g0398231 [Rosa chinensis]|uniref:Uncharacterized protein n=1 Tax=Rosa chinensis TaxID=74649 RepID=A0A2P6QS94_ROSCH|nr:hypothetical protein RchiOBHm_Chr4g0398231 [Rosa chinensis]